MKKLGGTGVDEEIELETQAEENVSGVLVAGNARIAESTKENGVEFVAEHFDGAIGEGDVFAKIFVGTPIEFDKFDWPVMMGDGGFDDVDCNRGDFLADAVTRNNGNARGGTAGSKRDVWHGGELR